MNIYLLLFMLTLLALILDLVAIPFIICWVNYNVIFDPFNKRSLHIFATPLMGGLGIFLGLLAVLTFFHFKVQIIAVLVCFAIMHFADYCDDRHEMKSLVKICIQGMCLILLYFSGFEVNNLYGIFGVYQLPSLFIAVVVILFIVGLINAFRLIDGIYGLVGGISLINAFFFGLIFFMNDQMNYAILAFTACGPVLGFLKYNISVAKKIMSDTGSLFLGLLMNMFMIKVFQTNINAEKSILVVAGLIFLQVFDTIRLFMQLILKRRNQFLADKNHLHYLVLRGFPKYMSSTQIILLLHFTLLGLFFLGLHSHNVLMLTLLIYALLAIVILFLSSFTVVHLWQKIEKS